MHKFFQRLGAVPRMIRVTLRQIYARYFGTLERFSGNAREVCLQIVERLWQGSFYRTSLGHYDYFWMRDFGTVAESLTNIGHKDKVQSTLRWALKAYRRANTVTLCIDKNGNTFNAPAKKSVDALPWLLHSLVVSEYKLTKVEKAFLQTRLRHYSKKFLDRKTGMLRHVLYAELRDAVNYNRSAYSLALIGRLSQCAQELGLNAFLFPPETYRRELLDTYWNGHFFKADSITDAYSSECALMPFYLKVVDDKEQPIPYANVYIENSFDGISTDEKGEFIFETFESGSQNLIISYVGYEEYKLTIDLDQELILDEVVLKEKLTSVNEVVITAGSFEASDENRVVILSPIDIVTTAGGRGDITGALQSLPGSQPQNEQEGLFVRGGDGSEAKTIIDGLLIQNPYGSSVPDIPQRSRFTPFEFEGTAFSTGGYSAQYGQALSSIVDLTTWNRFGDYNAHNLGVTPLSITYGRAVFNDSLGYGIRLDYSNLQPYQDFFNKSIFKDWFKSNYNFLRAPEGINITTDFKQKLDRGIFKYNGRFAINQSKLDLDELDALDDDFLFSLENRNSYYSFNYRGELSDSWAVQLGSSYSENIDYSDVSLPGELFPLVAPDTIIYVDSTLFIDESSYDDLLQFRSVFVRNIFSDSKLKFGLHFFDRKNKFLQFQLDQRVFLECENIQNLFTQCKENINQYYEDRYNEYNRELNEFLSAGFVEPLESTSIFFMHNNASVASCISISEK